MTSIQQLKSDYLRAKPRSRRRVETQLRLRDAVTKQLRREIRDQKRSHEESSRASQASCMGVHA